MRRGLVSEITVKHLGNWSWKEPFQTLALFDDEGIPVSVLRIFERTLVTDFSRVDAAGIGGLFTDEGYRGKGYASMLIEHVKEGREAVIAHSRRADCVFMKCDFVSIGPSPTRPDQELYLWTAAKHFYRNFRVEPADHF